MKFSMMEDVLIVKQLILIVQLVILRQLNLKKLLNVMNVAQKIQFDLLTNDHVYQRFKDVLFHLNNKLIRQ